MSEIEVAALNGKNSSKKSVVKLIKFLANCVTPHAKTDVGGVFHIGHIHKEMKCGLCLCEDWNCLRHFTNLTTEMCTVHRNRTLSRRYTRNVYCPQKQNIFQTIQQKCIPCIETEHFPNDTTEMCIVH